MSRALLQTLVKRLEAQPIEEALPECYGDFGSEEDCELCELKDHCAEASMISNVSHLGC